MPLVLFLVLLLRNDSEELVALLLRLRGHHDLLLDKLLSTGLIKFNSLLSSQFSLFFLFSTGSTLTVFEGSLGSESINLALTISGAFLKLSKSLDLKLLLCLDSSLLCCLSLLFSNTICIVPDNFEVLLSLLAQSFSLTVLGNGV